MGFSGLLETIMGIDKNIRFTLVSDFYGNTVCCRHREGVENYLTDYETSESLYNSAQMWKIRNEHSPKIGKGRYAFVEYGKISRLTMPLSEDRLLLVTIGNTENPMRLIEPILNQISYQEQVQLV